MRLAYFSPLNPVRSGISDYSEDLLPCLSALADVDLFVDGYKPSNPSIARDFEVHSYKRHDRLARERGYDATVYHMGNSPAHAYIYRALLRHPGVVVLHDFVLHHLVTWMAVQEGKAGKYLQAMEQLYGKEGLELGKRIFRGQRPNSIFDYPLCEEVIRKSTGVIVHSRYAEGKVRQLAPEKPVRQINMGIPLPDIRSKDEARRTLGLDPGTFVVSSFGYLNPYKRIDAALRAFRGLVAEIPDARFVIVGSPSTNYDPGQTVRMLGLENRVWLRGYATEGDFWDYVFASDACLSLRYPTAGETSAAALRLMGAGRPVLVSNTGSFMELPSSCCVKIDVDDCGEEEIMENLLLLAMLPALQEALGANARRYVAREHRLEDAAASYVGFVGDLTGMRAGAPRTMPAAVADVPRGGALRAAVIPPEVEESTEGAGAPDGPVEKGSPAAFSIEGAADLSPADGSEDSLAPSAHSPYLRELASEAAALGATEEDAGELEAIARVVAELLE